MSRDPNVRDRERAARLLDEALARRPANVQLRFIQFTFRGEEAARCHLLAGAPSRDKTDLVWLLATATAASSADRALAVEFAQEAAASAPPEDAARAVWLNTLAAAHAARGEFAPACQAQQQALEALRDDALRNAYASRLIHYLALKASPAGSVFDVRTLRNGSVRAFLVGRLRQETRVHLQKAVRDWLELLFPNDPALRIGEAGEPEF